MRTDRLKPRHLRFVRALAEHGQLSQVAYSMCISQPAASKTLSEVEHIVGEPVFVRDRRQWVPTQTGLVLRAFARRVLAEYDAFGSDVASLAGGLKGEVNVGLHTNSIYHVIAHATNEFKMNHPGVTVILREGLRHVLLESLRNGTLDLVFCRVEEAASDASLQTMAIGDDPMYVVASNGHPVLAQEPQDWSRLLAYPWIVPPVGTIMRNVFGRHLQSLGLDLPPDKVELDSISLLPRFLETRRYLALALRSTAYTWQAHGFAVVLPVDPLPQHEPVGVVWRKERIPKAARLLLSQIERTVQSEAPGRSKGGLST